MTSGTTDLTTHARAAQAMAEQLGPQRVLLPGPAYDDALPIWNGTVQGRPAAALPGGHPNLLAPGDHDQIAHACGPHAERLRAAKARFDPEGVFSATPLP